MTDYIAAADAQFRQIAGTYLGREIDPDSEEFEALANEYRDDYTTAAVNGVLEDTLLERTEKLQASLKEHFAKGDVPPKAAPEPKKVDTDFADDDLI